MNQKTTFKGHGFYRKSKAYGLVCGIALAGAVMMANTQVSADETTATTPTVTVTENSATNLVEAQSASSVENTQTAANAGQQTGELVSPVTSTELDTAVSEAQAAGVAVTTEETATTHDSLASAEADLSKQTAEVVTTTEKQQANTESIKAATEKNAEIDAQNKAEAERVAEVNKKGQAAVDQRNTLGQAAVDQRNKEGQAAVDARNAANQKRIEDNKRAVEERNKQGQAAVDQRNAQNQAAVDKRNAEGQAAIDEANKQAKAVADMENAQLKKEYEAALAGVKEVEAFNEEVRKRNAAAEAEAAKKNAVLQADYDKKVAEMKAKTNQDGYLSQTAVQDLIFTKEPNVSVTIQGQYANLSVASTNGADKTGNIFYLNSSNYQASDFVPSPVLSTTPNEGASIGDSYKILMKAGETTTVTYDGLENSSYQGKKISKVVYAFTPQKSNDASGLVTAFIFRDPTDTIKFGSNLGAGDLAFDFVAKYYYEDGSIVDFTGGSALISLSSLNASDSTTGIAGSSDAQAASKYYEFVSNTNGEFIKITGSTIDNYSGIIHSLTNNNADGSWDTPTSNKAYIGAGALKLTGTEIKLSFGSTSEANQWFAFNSSIKAPTLPAKPQPQKVTYEKEKEVPTTPVEPKYVTPEVKTFTPETFTPEVFTPEKPSTEEFKPETFTPETFTPEKYTPVTPTVLPHVQVPEKIQYKVAVHPVEVKQTPVNVKDVVDTDGVSTDGQLVPKGSIQTWTLTNANLKAGREEVTSYVMDDPFPADFEIDREATAAKNDAYLLSYDENGKVQLVATQATLNSFNANRDKDVVVPVAYFVGRPINDGGTYQNTFTTTIQTPTGEFKVVSNTPVIYTPGNDPKTPRDRGGENPTPHDNLIQPSKDVVDDKGQSIDGQSVLPNTTLHYVAKQNLDQYKGMEASQASIGKGFAYIDDYLDEALDGQSMSVDSIKAANGDDVTQLLQMYHVLSKDTLDDKLKAMVDAAGISPVGEFYMWVAKNPEDFYKAYVQKGLDITYNLSFKIKESFKEGEMTNTVSQIDFGNGYYGNVVKNTLPLLAVHKDVVDDKGSSIDNGTVAVGDDVTYRLEGWVVPVNRGYDLTEYRFVDMLDTIHDSYEGFEVKALVDFTMPDGTTVKAGDVLPASILKAITEQSYNAETGQFELFFKEDFLKTFTRDQAFGADVTIRAKRIAAGDVENEYVLFVNDNAVLSNKVVTHTPEPEKPSQSTPSNPSPSTPTQKVHVLPSTGEESNVLTVLSGMLLAGLSLVGIRKRKENVK